MQDASVFLSVCIGIVACQIRQTPFPGEHSKLAPPDPISNSEVKQLSADDSVGSPHVKVGHRQGFIIEKSG